MLDVNGWKNASINKPSVEVSFHVTSPFEFLEDHLVHPGSGVDQRGSNDGQRTTFLDVARSPKEAFGLVQRIGINTPR
jgi:hypothetical protein